MILKKLVWIVVIAFVILLNLFVLNNQKDFESIIIFAEGISTDIGNASYENMKKK